MFQTILLFLIYILSIIFVFSYKDIKIIVNIFISNRKRAKEINLKAIEMLKSNDLQEILNFTISYESLISNTNFMNLVDRTTKLATELVDQHKDNN